MTARSHPSGQRSRKRSSRQSKARTHSSRGTHGISRISSRSLMTRATVDHAPLRPACSPTVARQLFVRYPIPATRRAHPNGVVMLDIAPRWRLSAIVLPLTTMPHGSKRATRVAVPETQRARPAPRPRRSLTTLMRLEPPKESNREQRRPHASKGYPEPLVPSTHCGGARRQRRHGIHVKSCVIEQLDHCGAGEEPSMRSVQYSLILVLPSPQHQVQPNPPVRNAWETYQDAASRTEG